MSSSPVINGTSSPGGDSRDITDILDNAPSMNESHHSVHFGSSSPPVQPFACSFPTGMQTQQQPMIRQQAVPTTLNTKPTDPRETVSVSLSNPSSPSHSIGSPSSNPRTPLSKIDTIRQWSISTYKCTRQIISEKLGKTSRTIDTELEAKIEILRDTQRKYLTILRLSRALSSHFYHVVQTQQQLGEVFSDLAQKSPELQIEFITNSETQRTLVKNGESLLGALNFFVSSINTLCNKTMEDTLLTVRQYETARVEFDAYRADLDYLAQGPRNESSTARLDDAQKRFNENKERFDRLRADLAIKLTFLEENKVKVMHKQLLLFHNAVSAYFSGNNQALETTLKQFNIKMTSPNSAPPSWLEQ